MATLDLEKIAQYIKANGDRTVTLKELAEHMNYSEYHLSRSFKKESGYTLKQYMEAIKIEKSIESLLNEDQSVTDAALDSGYHSLTSFSNIFKRHTGITPKKFTLESELAFRFLLWWINRKKVLLHYADFKATENSLLLNISYPEGYQHRITCVGLFRSSLPKEEPIVGIATTQLHQIRIENIPEGEYFLLACEILEDFSFTKSYLLQSNFRQAIRPALVFDQQTELAYEIRMRRPIESDPPITMNIPVLLLKTFLKHRNSE